MLEKFSWPLISERGRIICCKQAVGFYWSIYLWLFYASFHSTLAMLAVLGEVKSFMVHLTGWWTNRKKLWFDGEKNPRPKQITQEEKEWIFTDINMSQGSCINAKYHPCANNVSEHRDKRDGLEKMFLLETSNWRMNSVSEHDKPHDSTCLL